MAPRPGTTRRPVPPDRGPCPNGPTAFTLIELLVVVAVIALLLAILAPATAPLIRVAHTVTCASNVHQLGNAAHSYAVDNAGQLPRDIWDGEDGHYLFAARFLPYLGGESIPADTSDHNFPAIAQKLRQAPVYQCPAVRLSGYYLHYVINGVDFGRYKKGEGYQSAPTCKLTQLVVSPTEALYIAEFNDRYSGMTATSFGYYDVWVPGHMPFSGLVPNGDPRMIRADDRRHFGATTVAFFDGHAQKRELTPYGVPLSLLNPLDTSGDP